MVCEKRMFLYYKEDKLVKTNSNTTSDSESKLVPQSNNDDKGNINKLYTSSNTDFPCTYYNEEDNPFDPYNLANWDGDQQIGFRSPRSP